MSEIKYEEIVLAAFLHDIGKFAQRAKADKYKAVGMESALCPSKQGGYYSHQHSLYTQGFLEQNKDCFPKDVNITNIIQLAAKHHNPSSNYEWIIAHADRISSGSDRLCNLFDYDKDDERKFYEKPFINTVSTVNIKNVEKGKPAYTPLETLGGDSLLASNDERISQEIYADLWKKFEKDFCGLSKPKNFEEFLLSLDSLLERYLWCVPSATNVDTDVSLYQHSKTTAAFAGVLFRYFEEKKPEHKENLPDDNIFLFINGDISGIQNYIFDLKSTTDNAKLLRARSFQILALSEIISHYCVKQFGVCGVNVLFSAGGKFMLVVPNTKNAKNLLEKLQFEIEIYFVREFGAKLNFCLSDGVEAKCTELEIDDKNHKNKINKLLNKIGEKADFAKSVKLQKYINKHGVKLDELYKKLQISGECKICEMPKEKESDEYCKNCKNLTEIGEKLTKAYFIELKTDKLLPFGEMIDIQKENKFQYFGYKINEYEAGSPIMYLPYTAPKNKNGSLLSFEEIAKKSDGVEKLAMFKADIDNLGLVFGNGLGERVSFSRYAQLSRILHCFFSQYYAEFVENSPIYKDKIYTVFSGGDDLCILGSWGAVMNFANDFHKAFNGFTNNNPSITMSGGIALANSNIPVRYIAEEAEKMLELSKNRRDRKDESKIVKNAITVFGTTVSWEEYQKCLQDGEKLNEALDNNELLSTGVVYKMIDFANRAKNAENGNLREMTWASNFRYMVARDLKDEDVKKQELKNWFLGFGTPEEMKKSRIAVSFALYKQRKSQEKES